MKTLIAVTATALLALGCSKCTGEPSATPTAPAPAANPVSDAMSQKAASVLAKAMESQGHKVESKGSQLVVGSHTLAIHAKPDYLTEDKGKVIAGLSFAFDVDGKPTPSLVCGSIGIDTSENQAIHTAIEEWAMQYGLAIARALEGGGKRPEGEKAPPAAGPFQAGRFTFYPGFTGIRGEAPDAFHGAPVVTQAFLAHIAPLVEQAVPASDAGLHAVTLTVVFKEGSEIQGECRLDGQVSAKLLDLVRSFAWPQVKGSFMLKQYFVFTASPPRAPGAKDE